MWVVAAITAALQSTLPFPALGPHVFVCRFLWIKWMERLARPRGTALRISVRHHPRYPQRSIQHRAGFAAHPQAQRLQPHQRRAPCCRSGTSPSCPSSTDPHTRPSDHHQQALHCPPCPQPTRAGGCRGTWGRFWRP